MSVSSVMDAVMSGELSGSKIEVSRDLHVKFKTWCKARGFKMKEMVEKAINDMMVSDPPPPPVQKQQPVKQPQVQQPEVKQSSNPWEQLPFWQKAPSKAQRERTSMQLLATLREELMDADIEDRTAYLKLLDQVNKLERELGLTQTRGGVGMAPGVLPPETFCRQCGNEREARKGPCTCVRGEER